jgi:hypothetical protein
MDARRSPPCGNALRPGRTSFFPSWQCVAPRMHVVLPLVATRCALDARRSSPRGNASHHGRNESHLRSNASSHGRRCVAPSWQRVERWTAVRRSLVAARRAMDGRALLPCGNVSSDGRTCFAPWWQCVEPWTDVCRSLVPTCRAVDGRASPPRRNVVTPRTACAPVPTRSRMGPDQVRQRRPHDSSPLTRQPPPFDDISADSDRPEFPEFPGQNFRNRNRSRGEPPFTRQAVPSGQRTRWIGRIEGATRALVQSKPECADRRPRCVRQRPARG